MTTQEKEISKIIVNGLSDIFKDKLDKIILYGSYARGDYDKESDVDILVLVKEDTETLKEYDDKISCLITDYCIKYGLLYSIVIKNKEQFEYYSDILPFYKNAVNEGTVLYGR